MSTAQTRMNGRDLMLFQLTSEGSVANGQAFACAKSCSVKISANTEEIADKDTSAFDEKEIKSISWEMSTTNLVGHFASYADLVEKMLKKEKIVLHFAPASNASTSAVKDVEDQKWKHLGYSEDDADGLYGTAIITSIDITASNDSKAEYSVTFQGSGELKRLKQG